MGVDCPTQVEPIRPREAIRSGIEGVVKVEAIVRGGVIDEKDIKFLSGPQVFRAAIRTALRQYKCSTERGQYTVTQEFKF